MTQSTIPILSSQNSCYPSTSSKTCLILALTLLLGLQTFAETKLRYTGELRLPLDLFTKEGVLLETGKFSLEVRLEQTHASLLFLKQEKVVASALAQATTDKPDPVATPVGIPILGTIHLTPIGSSDKEAEGKPAPSEYLPSFSWSASLRVYKSEDPENPEVNFVFLERDSDGKLLRRNFVLFSKKSQ